MSFSHISTSMLMVLVLASCGEMTSTTKEGNAVQEKQPDAGTAIAPAARDVDSKGGLTPQP